MTIRQFIKFRSTFDDQVGDLASDVLSEKQKTKGKSENEILAYLEYEASRAGITDVYNDFLAEYKVRKNMNSKK